MQSGGPAALGRKQLITGEQANQLGQQLMGSSSSALNSQQCSTSDELSECISHPPSASHHAPSNAAGSSATSCVLSKPRVTVSSRHCGAVTLQLMRQIIMERCVSELQVC